MTRPGNFPSQAGFEPRIFRSRGGRLNEASEAVSKSGFAVLLQLWPPVWFVTGVYRLVSPWLRAGDLCSAKLTTQYMAITAAGGFAVEHKRVSGT